MKLQKIILLAILLASKCIFAQNITDSASIKQQMSTYDRLYVLCRGGYPDDPNTAISCKKRDKIEVALQKVGWCYVGGWVHCKPKHQLQVSAADIVPSVKPLFALKTMQRAQNQLCFLLSGMMTGVPVWRDHEVPISRAYSNIDNVLFKMGVPSEDWKEWHVAVITIYNNPHITNGQVEAVMRQQCKKMPGYRQ